MDGGEGKGREYVCGDTRVCGCDERSAGAGADVGDAGTGVFCGENGGDGEWVLQGEAGEWDQWVCAGGGIKKKTGFGSVFSEWNPLLHKKPLFRFSVLES